jgi:hypothetical protein
VFDYRNLKIRQVKEHLWPKGLTLIL